MATVAHVYVTLLDALHPAEIPADFIRDVGLLPESLNQTNDPILKGYTLVPDARDGLAVRMKNLF